MNIRRLILSICCLCLLQDHAASRVYQRNPGDLLNPQWLQLKGWKTAESRPTVINGLEHNTDLWKVDKPLSIAFKELQNLYRQNSDPGHFSLGETMAWGKVRHGQTLHRYLLFSLYSRNSTLIMRLENPLHSSGKEIAQFDLLPPGVTNMRSIVQPESKTTLLQARSSQSLQSLRMFYHNRLQSDGWVKGLGDLYLKDGKFRMVHLLSTGQGSEVQISILTADQNPQMETNP